MNIIKPIAKFTLVTQILFPLLYSATSVASAVNTKQEKASHREVLAKIQSNLPELTSKQTDETHSLTGDELLAQGLNKSAQIISADNRLDAVENLAQSTAYGFASTQMTNWLNQYGNATIQISSDKSFSGEYFLPFYETEDNLFFSQSRIQRQNEDRTTLNLGLGYRYFMPNKMLGINSFYDRDLKNNHARLGLGAEFGANYIKLVANSYFRLTDWRDSRLSDFHKYDERPANGFDIKAEGFLPSYPQLGANIKYEKYFGDKVNLKGSNSISNLKTDPQAYTVGISYTPVPLLSFSLNQSMGDVNETKGELAVNYRFGVPLSKQLDTDLVPQMRTLMGARYNPVDRNNTIVMQYKKHEESATFDVNNVNQANITASESSLKVQNYVTLTVILKDSKNNPVTGKTVIIIKTDSSNNSSTVGTAPEVKGKDGEYTLMTTSDDSGKYTYGFKVNNEQAKSTVDVEYIAEPDEEPGDSSKYDITVDKKTETVGNLVQVTVNLKNGGDNNIKNVEKIIEKNTPNPDKNILNIQTVKKQGEGKYTAYVQAYSSGTYYFGFSANGKDYGYVEVVFTPEKANFDRFDENHSTISSRKEYVYLYSDNDDDHKTIVDVKFIDMFGNKTTAPEEPVQISLGNPSKQMFDCKAVAQDLGHYECEVAGRWGINIFYYMNKFYDRMQTFFEHRTYFVYDEVNVSTINPLKDSSGNDIPNSWSFTIESQHNKNLDEQQISLMNSKDTIHPSLYNVTHNGTAITVSSRLDIEDVTNPIKVSIGYGYGHGECELSKESTCENTKIY